MLTDFIILRVVSALVEISGDILKKHIDFEFLQNSMLMDALTYSQREGLLILQALLL